MKNSNILKSILIASTLVFTLHSCDKEEDPGQSPAVPLELDCDMQGLDQFIHADSTFTLVDRGTGVDYIINCVADVEGDLIIEPGVTIQFGEDGALDVNFGSIQAIGTAEKPITFTGEDKVPGSWGYIVFKTDDVKNKMHYCIVEHAGAFQVSSNGDKGNVIVMNSSRLEMENCTIRESEEYGVKITSSSAELPKFVNNIITSSKWPVHIPSNLVHNISGGSFTGNTNDAILVTSNGGGNNELVEPGDIHIWTKLDVPYQIAKTLKISGGTLEIMPGVVIQFENGVGIDVGESDASTLIANGTASERILFTGVTKAPGAWNKIEFRFTQSPLNSITYATIEYAGSDNGAIEMWSDPVLTVENVDFKNISSCAFYDNVPDFNPSAQVVNPNLSWSNLSYDGIANENSQTDQVNFPGGPFSYCH